MLVPSGPGPADWLLGLFRGFHPLRWLLCLVGIALTGLSAVVAGAVFEGRPPDFPGWWQQPIEHARALGAEIAGGSLGRIIGRGGSLLALNTALWCLIGGWIARHELVARWRKRFYAEEGRGEPSPTAFLAGWWKRLVVCCPSVLLVALFLLLPVLVAGWVIAGLGGLGALLVSLVLPVLLLADLILLVVALGAVGWPLMPVALAAECRDHFDALGRSYSYAIQREVRYLLLTATALGLAGLPWGVLYLFAVPMAAWQEGARQAVFLLATALSASIFWSLETVVYLHLRLAIDGVDAGEVAVRPLPEEKPEAPLPEGKAADQLSEWRRSRRAAPFSARRAVRATVTVFAAAVGSWCLTSWLVNSGSSGQAGWLGWGLSDTLVPPAEGVYRLASVIAGLWGVAWLALPFVWVARRLRSGSVPQDKPSAAVRASCSSTRPAS